MRPIRVRVTIVEGGTVWCNQHRILPGNRRRAMSIEGEIYWKKFDRMDGLPHGTKGLCVGQELVLRRRRWALGFLEPVWMLPSEYDDVASQLPSRPKGGHHGRTRRR